MSLYIGALIILAVAVALILIFKKLFNRNPNEVSNEQEISSREVIEKEVSKFDPKTGDPK
ncbi:hypothetical protein [Lunatimonas salinarum]|uniref:hypothetical protein n=1 Tax=Lunatimonas salinarum TaxID=1774590 RepID=UPI001ADF8A9C|nr:hypothetical protein [Lunatimonas salinarum]